VNNQIIAPINSFASAKNVFNLFSFLNSILVAIVFLFNGTEQVRPE
jgi:hypothetical protein